MGEDEETGMRGGWWEMGRRERSLVRQTEQLGIIMDVYTFLQEATKSGFV